jgi:hypothetical protein
VKRLALALLMLPWLSAPTPATAQPAAGASASATAGEHVAPLAVQKVPDGVSERPAAADWKTAKKVSLDGPLPEGCTARMLREWLRVRCRNLFPAGGSVVSGPSKDVAFYATVPKHRNAPGIFDRSKGLIEVVLPLRRGMSCLVQLTKMAADGGYGGWFGQDRLLLLSVQWPEDTPKPIVLTDLRPWRAEVMGMHMGDVEAAKAAGIEAKHGGPVVLKVEPGSAAEKGGAKPGDHVLFSDHWQDRLAFGNGATFRKMVLRKGSEKNIKLPRRRTSPP